MFLKLLKITAVINTFIFTSTSTSTLKGPVILPLDLITVFYLIKLLKNILKAVKATLNAIDASKAIKS